MMISRITCIACLIFATLTPTGLMADGPRAIVLFADATPLEERRAIVENAGAAVESELVLLPALVVALPRYAADRTRDTLRAQTAVLALEDDARYAALSPKRPVALTDNSLASKETIPWGVDRIDAEMVWEQSTGRSVRIALLDTGIDVRHRDLMENLKGGTNTVEPLAHFDDDNGHGTHIAGIIAASRNDFGVIGVAPEADLFAVKVLGRDGSGRLSDIIEGLEWSVNNRMQIINMGFGAFSSSPILHKAVKAVHRTGIIMVAPAGNDGNAVLYPAAYEETIAVSAIDSTNTLATWSAHGPTIDVTAPGGSIVSTMRGSRYGTLDGTSAAAAHVTGAMALMVENQPFTASSKMRYYLTSTAEHIALPNIEQGSGLVDAQETALITEPNP